MDIGTTEKRPRGRPRKTWTKKDVKKEPPVLTDGGSKFGYTPTPTPTIHHERQEMRDAIAIVQRDLTHLRSEYGKLVKNMLDAMEAAWKPQSDLTVKTIYGIRDSLHALRTDYAAPARAIAAQAVEGIRHELTAANGKHEVTNNSLQVIHKRVVEIEKRVTDHLDENARVTDARLDAMQAMIAQALDKAAPLSKKERKKAKKLKAKPSGEVAASH